MKHVLLSSVLATVCAVGSASPATIDKLEAFRVRKDMAVTPPVDVVARSIM